MTKRLLTILTLMIVGSYFVMFFPKVVANAYESIFQSGDEYDKGTTIGSLSIEGLNEEEAAQRLEQSVQEWKKQQPVLLSFADQKAEISSDQFQFLVRESLKAVKQGQENILYVNLDNNGIETELLKMVSEKFLENISMKALKAEIEKQVGLLDHSEGISVTKFLKGDFKNPKVLSTATVEIADNEQLFKWMADHSTMTVATKSSQAFTKDFVGENSAYSDDFLTKLSSGLYEASLQTNLDISERYISTNLPAGIKLGYEAKVNKKDLDLTLYNPNDFDIKIIFQAQGNKVTIEIHGYATGKRYKIVEKDKSTYDYKRIIHYDEDYQSKPNKSGKEGASITIYRDVYDDTNAKVESTMVSKDFYLPINEIVYRNPIQKEVLVTPTDETEDEELEVEEELAELP